MSLLSFFLFPKIHYQEQTDFSSTYMLANTKAVGCGQEHEFALTNSKAVNAFEAIETRTKSIQLTGNIPLLSKSYLHKLSY